MDASEGSTLGLKLMVHFTLRKVPLFYNSTLSEVCGVKGIGFIIQWCIPLSE